MAPKKRVLDIRSSYKQRRITEFGEPRNKKSGLPDVTSDDEGKVNAATSTSSATNSYSHSQSNSYVDIGLYITGREIDLSLKVKILESPSLPSANYNFPKYSKNKKEKLEKIFFEKSHTNYEWLVLSQEHKGLYCKYCAINYLKTHVSRRLLIKDPLTDFRDLGGNGALQRHQREQNHQKAVKEGETLQRNFHNSAVDISDTEENRKRLRAIVKTIILCGHQNIPLQGNIDDQILKEDQQTLENNESVVSSAEGNFRALLNFRVESGDTDLQKHLETPESKAKYISSALLSKLIDVCEKIIQENVFEKVKKAKYFSILFDEATDISHKTQLCLSVRYLQDNIIIDDFLTFCKIDEARLCSEDTDNKEAFKVGVALAKVVEKLCEKFDIDLKWCVGIGIDNCSVMATETKKAVVKELSKKAIHAKRCPSSNYILNNSLALVSCRNTSITMRKVVEFVNASPKRQQIFQDQLEASDQGPGICRTRWDEMHDGYLLFQKDNLKNICRALEKISKWQENETANNAHFLLHILRSSDFIISSICLNDVLDKTLKLSEVLQEPTSAMNLKRSLEATHVAKTRLQKQREDAVEYFPQLIRLGEQVAEQMGVKLQFPKSLSQQPAEEDYCNNIYIPLLDSVIECMSPEVIDLFELGVFLPEKSSRRDEECNASVNKLASNYATFINSAFENKYSNWMVKWQITDTEFIPQTLSETFKQCDEVLYPNIHIFLNILSVLPIRVAKAEESRSTLSRVKNWLRSSTARDHLTGPALLHIHKHVKIDVENVIDRFFETEVIYV